MRVVCLGLTALLLVSAPAARAAATRGFVLTSDYSSGALSAITTPGHAVSADVATVHSDAVARWFQGRLYVVNRFGADNVQVIDPAAAYATVKQFSVGPGTNPQDIALVSPTKAYVSRLGSPDLLIVNPATGASLGVIPLGGFADGDGNPEAARMTLQGSVLAIALQRLTNFQPQERARVVFVDVTADTVLDADPTAPGVQALSLQARNPVTAFVALPDPADPAAVDLLVGCVGVYGALDGGVERIVLPATHAPLPSPVVSAGLVTTEAQLGGDLSDIAVGPAHGYAVVSDAGFNTSAVSWDRATGAKLATVWATAGFGIADLAVNDRGELWVCDNSFDAPGVRIFRAGPDTAIAGPLDVGLPPVGVTFDALEDVPASVPAPAFETLTLAPPMPNPARFETVLRLTLRAPGPIDADVIDVGGRLVRVLRRGRAEAGELALRWDVRDAAGRTVEPGMYWLRVRSAAGERVKKCVIVR